MRHATTPTDVTLGGYSGRYLTWSAPEHWVVTGNGDFKGCDIQSNGHRDFVNWDSNRDDEQRTADGRPGRPAVGPRRQRAATGGRRQLCAGHDASAARRGGPGGAVTPVRLPPRRTSASPLRTGISVTPSRVTVTHVSRVAVRASASTQRTRPPATISSSRNTGARNWAEIAFDGRGLAGPRHDAGRHVAHREHAVGDDPREAGGAGDGVVARAAGSDRPPPRRRRTDIPAGDDAGERGELGSGLDTGERPACHSGPRSIITERAVHTGSPPSPHEVHHDREQAGRTLESGSTRCGAGS